MRKKRSRRNTTHTEKRSAAENGEWARGKNQRCKGKRGQKSNQDSTAEPDGIEELIEAWREKYAQTEELEK